LHAPHIVHRQIFKKLEQPFKFARKIPLNHSIDWGAFKAADIGSGVEMFYPRIQCVGHIFGTSGKVEIKEFSAFYSA
jgi:hypothetical protein